MDSFMIAVRVVVPMAILMAVGALMRLIHVADRPTMKKIDTMIFKIFMPLLVFYNIYKTDFSRLEGAGYIIYGTAGLVILFLVALFVVPRVIRRPDSAASMGQALLRGNYILFGAAVAESIYGAGNIGEVMLLSAVAVPCFNAMSAVVLEVGRSGKAKFSKLLLAILKNPMVSGAVLALVINFAGVKMPVLLEDVVADLSGLTTPMSFLSLGVSLDLKSMAGNRKMLLGGVFTRLIVIPVIFMAGAVALGFRGVPMCALLILFGAPTAVSSYPMAVAMEADGELAGQMVISTTLCSLATIFIWVMALSGAGLL